MLLAHHQNKHSTDTVDNNSGEGSKIKPEKGNGKTVNLALTLRSASSSETVLYLRLLEDPKE